MGYPVPWQRGWVRRRPHLGDTLRVVVVRWAWLA
jgi:hypothetical protein